MAECGLEGRPAVAGVLGGEAGGGAGTVELRVSLCTPPRPYPYPPPPVQARFFY